MTGLIFLIAGVLLFSGFFSGAEAALLSITQAEVETFLREKRWGASVLKIVQQSLNRAIIGIVIMNNIVNIVGSVLVGNRVLHLYGDAMLAITTAALTFSVILFSEILPKSLGIHYAPRIVILVAFPIRALTIALLPVIVLMEKMTNLFKRGEARKVGTEQQIRSLATLGRRAGHIESDEGQLIHRAFILNDKTAHDIMTPLKDVVYLEENEKIGEAVKEVFRENHSRYPVAGSSINDIRGVVMSYDILQAVVEGRGGKKVRTIMEPTLVVSAGTRGDRLLMLFRDKNKHQAVVQEDGKTVGIVTLEDVIEELVGEIEDERDAREDQ